MYPPPSGQNLYQGNQPPRSPADYYDNNNYPPNTNVNPYVNPTFNPYPPSGNVPYVNPTFNPYPPNTNVNPYVNPTFNPYPPNTNVPYVNPTFNPHPPSGNVNSGNSSNNISINVSPQPQPQPQSSPIFIINPGNNSGNGNGQYCPFCRNSTGTIPVRRSGTTAWLWCCCLFWLVAPCCSCLPFFIDTCLDVHLTCQNCSNTKTIIQARCC